MNNKLLGTTRRGTLGLAAAAVMTALALPAAAEEWPTRPVTMVVPYGPGASNDTFTRAISDVLTKNLGVPFVVENRSGAGGFVGANSVKMSEPDGYTFLEAPSAIAGLGPIGKVDLDVHADFEPVGLLATSPTAMTINASIPANNVKEFVEWAKANPDKAFYGYAGVGATSHLHGELFNFITGSQLTGVNYKNSADSQADVVAGRLAATFVSVASTRGQIEAGQLKLLAYADGNHPSSAPDAPTMAEAGYEGFDVAQLFWAVFAPKGTPDEIVQKMNAAINEALADPAIVELMEKSGATPAPGPSSALAEMLASEGKVLVDFMSRVKLE